VHQPKGGAKRVIGIVIAAWFLIALAVPILGLGPGDSSSSSSSPSSGQVQQIETSWQIAPADLDNSMPDETIFLPNLDGSFDSEYVLQGEAAWVVAADSEDDYPRQIFGLDPGTGDALWQAELPAYCGRAIIDDELVCLARDDADEWQLVILDVTTGDEVGRHPTEVSSVRAVHRSEAGLLVVGDPDPVPHAMVTMLALDGTTSWSVDLGALDDAGQLFGDFLARDFSGDEEPEATMERLRWRELDEGRVLLFSTPGVALIDTEAGDVLVHQCLRATPAQEAYFCAGDGGITRHDLDGQVEWTLADMTLASPTSTSPGRPVALTEDHQWFAVDWETGERGEPLAQFEPRNASTGLPPLPPTVLGDAEHTFVRDDQVLIALEPGSDQIAWQMDLDERHVDEVITLQDMAVLDSYPHLALDVRTGEELWERRIPTGIYLDFLDHQLVSSGLSEIAALELP